MNIINDLTLLDTNIEKLFLYDNKIITDFTNLSLLTELKNLDLSNTLISNLTPLSLLTKLIDLNLNKTQISNLT
jgi:Leucine-rich repeat (LRR) protein